MATVEQRYNAATDYVRRAIQQGERAALHTWASIVPAIFATEVYAGQLKTEPVKNDLKKIEERWLRASNDIERAGVARDAELLADRTEENLPGAPTDWKRTNLTKTEAPRITPATTYTDEVEHEATEDWSWVKETASVAALPPLIASVHGPPAGLFRNTVRVKYQPVVPVGVIVHTVPSGPVSVAVTGDPNALREM